MARLYIVFKLPGIHAAISICVDSLTVLSVISEISDIFITGELGIRPPGFGAPARFHTIREETDVFSSVGIGVSAFAIGLVILKHTDVSVSGATCFSTPDFGAFTAFHIIYERTRISAAIGIGIATLTILFVISEVTNIFMAGQSCFGAPRQSAPAVSGAIFEFTDVYAAIRIGIRALTVEPIIAEVSDIGVPSQICLSPPGQGTLTVLYIIFKSPNICASIRIGESTLTV